MTEPTRETMVGLLRALQRQFADLGNLATSKALELPDTSFTHYRKLGEAAGLHTAWRMVADLADQLAEGRGKAAQTVQELPEEDVQVSETNTKARGAKWRFTPLADARAGAGEPADAAGDLVPQVWPPAGAAGGRQ